MASNEQNNLAHIPATLAAPLLMMTYGEPRTGNWPTIFIGIVDDNYIEEMWNHDKRRIMSLFALTDPLCIGEIKVRNKGNRCVDADQLGIDMGVALDSVNKTGTKVLRIVTLGKGYSPVVLEGLEALILGWCIPPEEKELDFIAVGESSDHLNLNLCKNLVMKKSCKTLRYYSARDYNIFGNLQTDRHDQLRHISAGVLSSVLEAMTGNSAEMINEMLKTGLNEKGQPKKDP